MKEIIKQLKQDKNYAISNYGYVFNLTNGKVLKPYTNYKGDNYRVFIKVRSYTLYKLVMQHFKKTEYDSSGIHLDFNRKNNANPNLKKVTGHSAMIQWKKAEKNKIRCVYPNPHYKPHIKKSKPYKGCLNVNFKQIHIGYFKTKKEAKLACFKKFKLIYGFNMVKSYKRGEKWKV
jgi:hypothetical protein